MRRIKNKRSFLRSILSGSSWGRGGWSFLPWRGLFRRHANEGKIFNLREILWKQMQILFSLNKANFIILSMLVEILASENAGDSTRWACEGEAPEFHWEQYWSTWKEFWVLNTQKNKYIYIFPSYVFCFLEFPSLFFFP